jgi:hypothetical protein
MNQTSFLEDFEHALLASLLDLRGFLFPLLLRICNFGEVFLTYPSLTSFALDLQSSKSASRADVDVSPGIIPRED